MTGGSAMGDNARLGAMRSNNLLGTTAADGSSLLAAAASGWSRPVPHCPGWDAADLVRHMGGILAWMAAIVASRERVSRRSLDPPPGSLADLPAWYSANLRRTIGILTDTDPGARTWTFSSRGELSAGWWRHRLAVEMAIHRWDAQHAAAIAGALPPQPLEGTIAAAGVEEFLTEFLPGLLAQDTAGGLGGTLHLHATDGGSEWWIDLDARAGAEAIPRHAKADTAIRGTRSSLLLWLTNRESPASLEIFGRAEVAQRWNQLRR